MRKALMFVLFNALAWIFGYLSCNLTNFDYLFSCVGVGYLIVLLGFLIWKSR